MKDNNLKITKLLIVCLVLFSNLTTANDKPNILLITADDLGFDDLSLNEHPYVNTSSIDNLAQRSVQFSDYSVTPVCATTRASLLTGRDFYETGVSGVHGGRDFLNRSEVLISDVLREHGYRTGTWGKWHVGKTKGYLPEDRGFDEAYYAELYKHENSQGFFNGKPVTHEKWVSEVITDYTIDFIDRSGEAPFFAYASYLAPHEPWLAPKQFTEKFLKLGMRPAIANLYGMIEEMDFQINRLLTHLEEQGLAQNTIVIFMSDNGPWWDSSNLGAMTKNEWAVRNPSNLYGNKGQSWQNGIKSPLFVQWKGRWEPARVDRYVDVKDIFPTLLDASGITLNENHKPLAGTSFLNYLQGDTKGPNSRETYIASHDVISEKALFNQWTPVDQSAKDKMHYESQMIGVRTENYKLLLNPAIDRKGYPKATNNYLLFDMSVDPKERRNVFLERPDVATKMISLLKEKYRNISENNGSFAPPRYIVDATQNVSIVNGFGASSTRGNTTNKAHFMAGMKSPGDAAYYDIEVSENGSFDVYIELENTDAAGINVGLSAGDIEVTHQLTESLLQKIGVMSLDSGLRSIEFKVIENNSYKPWAQVSKLRRFYFVPEGQKLHPESLAFPR